MTKLYRVLRTLSRGEGKYIWHGSLTRLEWLGEDGVERLLAIDAISVVQPPPLSVLPGWKRRSALLAKMDIIDVAQFLLTDTDAIAPRVGRKDAAIEGWKREVEGWLQADPPSGG